MEIIDWVVLDIPRLNKKTGDEAIFANCHSCKVSDCQNRLRCQPDFLLYQSEKMAGKEKNGSLAEDMRCGDLEMRDLVRIYYEISKNDYSQLLKLEKLEYEPLFDEFSDLMKQGSLLNKDMQAVALQMVEHFKAGSGSDFSNEKLTRVVMYHESTMKYIGDVWQIFKKALEDENYNLHKAKMNENFSDTINYELTRPKFNKVPFDVLNGLSITVDDTHGLNITVKNYIYCAKLKRYRGVLNFNIYDHFGLDSPDIEEKPFGLVSGFRAWFCLQRYEGFKKRFKPFITRFILNFEFDSINPVDSVFGFQTI